MKNIFINRLFNLTMLFKKSTQLFYYRMSVSSQFPPRVRCFLSEEFLEKYSYAGAIENVDQHRSRICFEGIEKKSGNHMFVKISKKGIYKHYSNGCREFDFHNEFRSNSSYDPSEFIISPTYASKYVLESTNFDAYFDAYVALVYPMHMYDLFTFLLTDTQPFSESKAKPIFRQLVRCVNHLHSHGYIHLDLKPENFMCTTEGIRLIDFEVTQKLGKRKELILREETGTLGYQAPELRRNNIASYKSDVWSLGIILYMLIAGFPPFIINNGVVEYKFNYITNPAIFPVSFSANVIDLLLNKMLVEDPNDRISILELCDHPWFTSSKI